jgi:hypothetical protein
MECRFLGNGRRCGGPIASIPTRPAERVCRGRWLGYNGTLCSPSIALKASRQEDRTYADLCL